MIIKVSMKNAKKNTKPVLDKFTAKADNLDPHSYLRFLFDKLSHAKSENDSQSLLPNRLNQEKLVLSIGVV